MMDMLNKYLRALCKRGSMKEYFHKQDELSLMFDKMSSKSFSENTSYRIDISRFLSRTSVFKK